MEPTATAELRDTLYGRLTWSTKARLVVEILRTYVAVRRKLAREQVPQVLADVRQTPIAVSTPPLGPRGAEPDRAHNQAAAARLGWVVRRTLDALPADATCLIQSVVLVAILARRGIDTSLIIGVKPRPTFAAHAWVEYDGQALLPGAQDNYERLSEL